MSDKRVTVQDTHWGWFFFTAYIGAAIYFIQQADGFWSVVLAFLQAMVWPAYVIHAALGMMGIQ